MSIPFALRIFLFAFAAYLASAANFTGFNSGPFFSVVGTTMSTTSPTPLHVSFDEPVLFDAFVAISSSDPAILTIEGGGVFVPAGQSNAIVIVSSYALGTVSVTGFFGPTVATNTIRVVSEIPVIPALNISSFPNAVQLTWPTNSTGFLLETNSVPDHSAGWGVLASNYTILNTNFSVTVPPTANARFFRLRLP